MKLGVRCKYLNNKLRSLLLELLSKMPHQASYFPIPNFHLTNLNWLLLMNLFGLLELEELLMQRRLIQFIRTLRHFSLSPFKCCTVGHVTIRMQVHLLVGMELMDCLLVEHPWILTHLVVLLKQCLCNKSSFQRQEGVI